MIQNSPIQAGASPKPGPLGGEENSLVKQSGWAAWADSLLLSDHEHYSMQSETTWRNDPQISSVRETVDLDLAGSMTPARPWSYRHRSTGQGERQNAS